MSHSTCFSHPVLKPCLWLLAGVLLIPTVHAQTADCTYSISSEWNSGYTATIRLTNTSSQTMNGWDVSWHYNNNQITNSWNALLSGNNPWHAAPLAWNGDITPGTFVEFGFQVEKNGGATEYPELQGSVCSNSSQQSSIASTSSQASSLLASPSSIAVASSSSITSAVSSPAAIASSSSVAPAQGGQCNWYGTLYALCVTTVAGWGWENNQSCIAATTCTEQPSPWGIVGASSSSSVSSPPDSSSQSSQSSRISVGGFVSQHGHLRASGTQLVDQNSQSIQLRGMSSHGLQWYGEYMNIDSIRWLRDDWDINIIRAAMYTSSDGYISDPSVKYKVFEMIEAAIELDIYILVDWHILSDGNPQTYQNEAKIFFNEVASRYGNTPNIIYEIANEPNGGGVNWNNAIRPYAENVIPVIRQHAPDSLVIVGTATWSQDVDDAAANPVSYPNVGYAMHFYACTHGQWLKDKIDQARAQGALIFSTEWGTADATGDGQVCEYQTREWIHFLNQRGISWVNWSITPKEEGTAALRPGASPLGNWGANDLSPSGSLVRELINK